MADNETKNPDEEPSIEEILSSIRDIISEDDEAEAVADEAEVVVEAKVEPEPAKEESLVDKVFAKEKEEEPAAVEVEKPKDEDDDVLELTDLAEEDQPAAEPEEKDPLAGIDLGHPDEDDLDIIEEEPETMDNDAVDDIFDSIEVSEETAEAEAEIDVFDAITSDDMPAVIDEPVAEDALVDKIAETATIGAMVKLAENIAVSRTKEGVTLEDIVKQSLRPMLKEWLDENLPTLIERLVSLELERLANKAAGK